VKVRLNL